MRIRLFVATPGDVAERRNPIDQVVAQINSTLCRDLNANLEAIRWETDAPIGPSERLQGAINPVLDDADLALVIFWRRFGTPSGIAQSGTAEEYYRALNHWRQRGYPKPLVYFCNAPAPPPRTVHEATQMLEVARFREHADRDGITRFYETGEEFSVALLKDLYTAVGDVARLRNLPVERGLAAGLDREREVCRRADRPFHTPSLLQALLKRPGSGLQSALERLEPSLSATVSAWLSDAEARLSAAPEHSYLDFDWMDRNDMRDALALAHDASEDRISERHLFAAVVARGSSTIIALRGYLGAELFDRMVAAVQSQAVAIGYGHLLQKNGGSQ